MHGLRHTNTNTNTARSRQRPRLAKENRRDLISYSDLPLPKSIRGEIINAVRPTVKHGVDDVGMTTAQWRKRSGLLIAQSLVRTLIEKNGNALRYERFLAFIIRELESM
jgi:hypothetical protein